MNEPHPQLETQSQPVWPFLLERLGTEWIFRLLPVALLALAGATGCTSESSTSVASETMNCGLVVAQPDGTIRHLVDGDEVELLKGYQGYLLVQAQAHVWGELPRTVALKMSGALIGGPPMVSVVAARPPKAATDGHQGSEPLEIWLSPPDPKVFADKDGRLTLEVKGAGRTCSVDVAVRFVDRTYCIHYDDGSVTCPKK
ncbi:MAG: hypothetical protein KC502_12015 [Myxococcales bacterium]|nr:hypothetical protein [Myxococcales bacterium]